MRIKWTRATTAHVRNETAHVKKINSFDLDEYSSPNFENTKTRIPEKK